MKKLIIVVLLAFIIPSVSSASFDVSLKYGSRGVAVEELQDFLQDQNLYTGKIDGKLGLGTVRSIKLFQSANSLKADGYFGIASRNKAKIILADSLKESDDSEKAETGVVVPPVKEVSKETRELLRRVDELKNRLDEQTKIQGQIASNTKPKATVLPPTPAPIPTVTPIVPLPIKKGTLVLSITNNSIDIGVKSYSGGVEGVDFQILKSPSNLKERNTDPRCFPASKDTRELCSDYTSFVLFDKTTEKILDFPNDGTKYLFTIGAGGKVFNLDIAKGDAGQSFNLD